MQLELTQPTRLAGFPSSRGGEPAHLIVGAILPIWDRLATGLKGVVRTETDDGRRWLGSQIYDKSIDDVLRRLNVASATSKMTPAQVMDRVLQGSTAELANGWTLRRSKVSGEDRIELSAGPYPSAALQREFENIGMLCERISWQDRFFVPTGAEGVPVWQRLTASRPVIGFKGEELADYGGDPDAAFSRSGTGAGASASDIAQVAQELVGQFAHQPPILVRDSARGVLPGVGDGDTVAGAVHGGRIYLFLDQLARRSDVVKTLWHEFLHYGLRRFLTREQFEDRMHELYAGDLWVRREANAWARSDEGRTAAKFGGERYALARGVDEALAQLAENNRGEAEKADLWQRIVRRVTTWLADLADRFGFRDAAAQLRAFSLQQRPGARL